MLKKKFTGFIYNMKIQNSYINPNFKAKLDTASVLEVTSLKIFKNEGINGFKYVIEKLEPINKKAIGWRGYAFYAKQLREKIINKYPEIKEATDEILEITEKFPNIKKQRLQERIQPIIERLGETVDIEI